MYSRFSLRAAVGVAVLAAGPLLAGCSGVVKNLNSAQVNVPNVDVANPFGLDQKTASVTVRNVAGGNTVAAASAIQAHDGSVGNVNTFSFPDQTPVGLADIKSAQVSFNLVPKVTLAGTGLPTAFTLTTFTVNGTVSDTGSSVALTQVATSGPIHFTQQTDGSYTADAGTFQLAQATKTNDTQLQSLLNIVTAAPTPNTATLTLNATSPDLPDGTVLTITFNSTKLTVSASS